MKRRFLYWVSYLACLLAALIIADYGFYLAFSRRLPEAPPSSPRDPAIALTGGKESSIRNFKPEKIPGTIRIGCFGDSYTAGCDVNSIYDYPGQLDRMLKTAGYLNTQVLNFGKGGFGFQQAVMTYEALGKAYGIDYALFGPSLFYPRRDTTFCASGQDQDGKLAYTYHPRYILPKNGSRAIRLDPIGSNEKRQHSNYWGFIPRLKYLRYDSRPPAFLQAPVSLLAPGRELKRNPFYYQRDPEMETKTLDQLLLRMISNKDIPVIAGNRNPILFEGFKESSAPCPYFFQANFREMFPYLAYGHLSPSGNNIIARQFFDLLTGKPDSELELIKTEDIPPRHADGLNNQASVPLSACKDAFLEIEGTPIGRFYSTIYFPQEYCMNSACDSTVKNVFEGIYSLLGIKDRETSPCDVSYIPLPFTIKSSDSLILSVETAQGKSEYDLGKICMVDGNIPIGILNLGGNVSHPSDSKHPLIIQVKTPLDYPRLLKAQITINGTAILEAKGPQEGHKIRFNCVKGNWMLIRSPGNQLLETGNLPDNGTVWLKIETAQDGQRRVAFARWSKFREKTEFSRPLDRKLQKTKSKVRDSD